MSHHGCVRRRGPKGKRAERVFRDDALQPDGSISGHTVQVGPTLQPPWLWTIWRIVNVKALNVCHIRYWELLPRVVMAQLGSEALLRGTTLG